MIADNGSRTTAVPRSSTLFAARLAPTAGCNIGALGRHSDQLQRAQVALLGAFELVAVLREAGLDRDGFRETRRTRE